MASIESLIFDIVAKDHASDGLSRVSKAADSAAGSTDTLNRRLDELGRKTAQARVELAGDKDAQARLDKIDARLVSLDRRTASPKLTVEGAARAIADISAVDLELDKLGGKGGSAESAAASLGSGAGGLSGPGGIGALIAGGVALAPVLLTVGLGLGGLGLAAYTASKNADEMGKILGPLKADVAGFSASLQPEVLAAFGEASVIAQHGLKDIQPVAAATGRALDSVLGQIDREFQSGQWQSFFSWMAKTAGPDVQQLGGLFTSLAADLPPLLEGLQPVASEILTLATGAANAAGILEQLAGRLADVGTAAVKAAEITSGSTGPGDTLTNPWKDFTNFLGDVSRSVPGASKLVTALGGGVASAGIAAANAGAEAAGAGKQIGGMGASAGVAAAQVQTLAQRVSGLTAAESAALSPLLAYTNDLIAQRNDADKLSTALQGSHDKIGLATAAQRGSFTAANTYIQDLLNTASAAVKSHQGIDAQISSIRGALPLLEHVKGGTRQYWQEVQSLVGWLHELEKIKSLSEVVTIKGQGTWSFSSGGNVFPVKAAASGMYVAQGSGPVADDVLVRASRGELIVPASMVSSGAVDHLRGQIPGFAAGGIITGYEGQLRGLQPWAGHDMNATVMAITSSIAGAMARQQAAATAAFAGGPAAYGSAAAAQAFARSILPGGWSWPALLALWNRESGWNSYAVNPSSGAYGIPQALGKGHPYALGDYANQVRWGIGYIGGRYGNSQNAWAHEAAAGWYGNGLDATFSSPTLIGVGERGAERVTVTPAGRGGGVVIQNLNVNVGPGVVNGAVVGRQIAEYLKQFKKSGGKY